MRRMARYACLIGMVLLTGTASAQVQPEPAPLPWERDVSAEDMRMAEELFAQAVDLHERLLRDQAVARYEQALAHWENPHIRWNLALLMQDMGQYVRAHEHLERALAWGPQGFDEHDLKKLLAMQQTLLQHHLAVVEVRCDEPGAEITLDRRLWFRGPGLARQVVLPGEHVIAARKPGYFPVYRNIDLRAGTQGAVVMSMSVNAVFEEQRWKKWNRWYVLGPALAMGAVGAGLELHARTLIDAGNRELADRCGGAQECAPVRPGSYQVGQWEHRAAIGAMIMGGTLAAAALVVEVLNRPRTHRSENRGESMFQVVPMAFPDTAGVSAQLRF